MLTAISSRHAQDACLYHVEASFWRLIAHPIPCALMAGECGGSIYDGDPWMLHVSRIFVGCVAGLVVALVKAAADNTDFTAVISGLTLGGIVAKVIGYSLVPVILGAVGGWISDEVKVHKIFWVAISAPVIIAAAASGWSSKTPQVLPVGKAGWNFEQILSITPAYAQEATTTVHVVDAAQSESPFISGLKAFFGDVSSNQRYRVVVASIKDYDKAKAEADRLNSLKGLLPAPATVGPKKIGNEYFPVVVDGWLSYQQAKELRDRVASLDLGLTDAPYVSIRDY